MIARCCKELALRILVNLTNENKSLCKDIVTDRLMLPALIRMFVASSTNFEDLFDADGRPSEPNSAQTPDTLLLGLALLTNIIQEFKESSQWIRKMCELSDHVCGKLDQQLTPHRLFQLMHQQTQMSFRLCLFI